MSKYFKKGSVPFKIFACFISVVLVLGCAFVPGTAFATSPPSKTPGPNNHDKQFTQMLLHPGWSETYWYDESYATDPLGYSQGETFKMIEQNSVFNLTHANQEEMKEWANVWQNYSPGTTGKFASSFTNNYVDSNQVPNAMRWCDALQAVSFNLSADVPQNDHIAVIGFDYGDKKKVKLWIYNAKTKKWSDAKVVGNLSWSDDGGDSYYGDLEPFMSITAGDYDGDNVDTVVTYAADCNSSNEYYGVTEWNIMDSIDGKPVVAEKNGRDREFKLLNPAYTKKIVVDGQEKDGKTEIFNHAGHHHAGNGSLHAILKTGDFNGDNIDDLAVLSSLEFSSSDEAKKYDWRLGVPYLSISNGQKDGKLLDKEPFYGNYVGDYNEAAKTCNSMATANFAVARLGKHSADSIVVGGRGWSFSGDASGNRSDATRNDTLSMARYDLKDDGSFGFNTYTSQCYEQNSILPSTNTKNGFGTECNYGGGNGHWAWNPICAQAVYMNGKGNDPYILMDGDLYHWKENGDAPQKIFKYKDKDGNGLSNYYPGDQNFFPLACTCAGVWDGNTQGYEQVAFGLCHRQGGSGGNVDDYNVTYITIGINPNAHDATTGLPSAVTQAAGEAYDSGYSNDLFFCTSKKDDRQVDDKGSISNNGLHFPLCNMDYSAEEGGVAGVVAKYTASGLTYCDPIVECILQAAPYYHGTESSCAGNTGFIEKYTMSKEVTQSNEVSEEDGYGTSFKYSGIFLNLSTKQSKGSIESYGRKFSEKISVGRDLEKAATDENVVLVRRYPFCIYSYETYDPSTKSWEENVTNSYLKWDQVLEAAFSIPGYKYFADEYNNLCNGADSLDYLDETNELYKNEGEPEYYLPIGTKRNDLETKTDPKVVGNKEFWQDEPYIEAESSNSWEQKNGLHFHYEQKIGIGLGFSHWALGLDKDNYHDTTELWGTSTTNSKKYRIGLHFRVESPPTYLDLLWVQGAKWDSNLLTGKKDEEGKDIHVPVYGYLESIYIPDTYQNSYTNGSTGSEGTKNSDEVAEPVNDIEISEDRASGSEVKGASLTSFIGPMLAYADEADNTCLNFKWNTGDNSSECSYQVYTSINGEIMKVGNPVKGGEFTLDLNNPSPDMKEVAEKLKNQEWPIYQFAVSTISPSGKEGQMSGWVYFCSSKYFKEAASCYVARNDVHADARLKIRTKLANQESKTRLIDSIGLLRTNEHKIARLIFGNGFRNNETSDIQLKDEFAYKVEDFEFLKTDGQDCLYNVKFASKDNPNDVKNFVIRMDDGKLSIERIIEAEILSNWTSVDAIKAAMDNEATREATAKKLSDISEDLHSSAGLRVTGPAKEVYYAGIDSFNQYYGPDYSGTIVAFVILVIGAAGLVALALFLFFRDKKANTGKAKSKSKKKYGTY